MRITILISDKAEADLTYATLADAGHRCEHVMQSGAATSKLRHEESDLFLMDCASTDGKAAQLARACRESGIPVLLIAGKSDDDDIAACMEAGANDYLVKPVRRGELLARVRVFQRRFQPAPQAAEKLQFGPYLFDTTGWHASRAGKTVTLTRKEFELALLFFRHLGRPLSRTYIQESIWSGESDVPSRTMDTHVSRVRSKLALRPENGFRLSPVYSFGYQLEQLG